MQVFKRYVSARGLTVFSCELFLIAGSLLVVTRLYGPLDDPDLVWKILLPTGLCLVCLYYNDFYDLTLVNSSRETVVRLFQAGGTACIILGLIYFAVPSVAIQEGAFLTSLGVLLAGILAWRLLFAAVARTPRLSENILIVGSGPAATALAHKILEQHEFAYRLVGFADDTPADDAPYAQSQLLGGTKDIRALVAEYEVDRVVVCLPDRRGRMPIEELISAKLSGIRVEEATATYERLSGKILLEDLKPSSLIFSTGFYVSRTRRVIKRAIDIALSIGGLIAALPVMALTAVAVWLESGPPVLYRQDRVGEHGRVFSLLKFRSMRVNAEGDLPMWAQEGDDRVTRVGRFIRFTRLDELPQLWSVLRGHMSFVGPRPERPYFVELLAKQIPFFHQRHAVKPGVTGWAQIKYRYGASVEDAIEKLRYDLYYIKHQSTIFDLTIIFDTVKVILSGKGAQ